jgi:hypothetical protein
VIASSALRAADRLFRENMVREAIEQYEYQEAIELEIE